MSVEYAAPFQRPPAEVRKQKLQITFEHNLLTAQDCDTSSIELMERHKQRKTPLSRLHLHI
jgi:hypothetical protein